MSESLTDIRNGMISTIPCEPESARKELEAVGFSDLLGIYMNWIDRLIEPRPRQIRFSLGFWDDRAAAQVAPIMAIAELSEKGKNLEAYLSPRVRSSGYVPNEKSRSGLVTGGKDRALNAYGTHHLHLVPGNAKGKRPGQSADLLFVKVRRDHMVFVMCGGHGSFNDGTLRQAVADLDVASGNYIRGIEGVTPERTAREGEALLRQGSNSATMSKGLYTMPGYLSSALTSARHRQHADEIADVIERLEPLARSDNGRAQICQEFGLNHSEDIRFGWALLYSTLYLVEAKSKKAVAQVPYRNI
ncbi:hypothetical protein GGE12_005564 [Rhizobium mongolense]|uniref:Uncharacterized protein n=1 Tax=Rhizobium mongolense TaxID=57676 RepID=A0A7W6RTQ6_9HYPH|nr:hypothetical protein [Rhizobium mongolense]